MAKLRVGLFFGGRSTEHEVSVVSGIQAYEQFDKEKYEIIPIYVSKEGQFYTNPKFLDLKNYKDLDQLLLSSTKITLSNKGNQGGYWQIKTFPKFTPIEVAFPLFHGSFGEDGCIQGLFEMYKIPYVGLSVMGSAVSMDKVATKWLFKSLGIPSANFTYVNRASWNEDSKKSLREIKNVVGYPMFVKPVTIGSSIGVNKAIDDDSLSFAIEVASTYSEKIMIEDAFEDVIEVNCSAMGDSEMTFTSVCEMPLPSSEVLSFADKYMKGGGKGNKSSGMASLSRVIPAPIPQQLAREIQLATSWVFQSLDGFGVIRVDFFVDQKKNKFWINEVNPIPGSLSFYLWDKTPDPFKPTSDETLRYPKLLDKLIEFALKREEKRKKTQYVFNSGLLGQMAISGGGTKR